MEHKFVKSEHDDRRHCMYCGFYEDYAELHCPARAEETRLIGAAPDMYEALQYVNGSLKALQILGVDTQEFINVAEKALSKAEGRE